LRTDGNGGEKRANVAIEPIFIHTEFGISVRIPLKPTLTCLPSFR